MRSRKVELSLVGFDRKGMGMHPAGSEDPAGARIRLARELKRPLDDACRQFGQKWFITSGAMEKMMESQVSYHEYVHAQQREAEEHLRADVEAIQKDLPRTSAKSFSAPGMEDFFAHFDAEELKKKIGRVLLGFVQRNFEKGYTQGLNFIVCFLLGFLEESKAFWVCRAPWI